MNLQRLYSCLEYSPDTGEFRWKESMGKKLAGKKAGSKHVLGYVTIKLDGKRGLAHRVAYAMHYGIDMGDLPGELDHINGERDDNRIENLRPSNRSRNNSNRSGLYSNTSGYKGVSWHSEARRWRAGIKINGKSIYLGLFVDPVEAAKSYDRKAVELFGDHCTTNRSLGRI